MNQLIDQFNRHHTYLRISVTDRCNLRCTYCMPAEGITPDKRAHLLTYDEIVRLSSIFAKLGVEKIRITGGEPLVRKNLHELIFLLKNIPGIKTLGMTTNGVLFARQLNQLKKAGLDKLNLSLDSLKRERFKLITLRDHHEDVLTSINAAIDAGYAPVKLNTVVIKGFNDDELGNFIELARNRPLNIRFIEYMPFKSNRWNMESFISYTDMIHMIRRKYNLIPVSSETDPGGVAKDYRIDGFSGNISFITSMSEHFCDTCNRIRLTADGAIKSCLFHSSEVSLRDLMRDNATDDELTELIKKAVVMKPAAHAPVEELIRMDNRTMTEIGG